MELEDILIKMVIIMMVNGRMTRKRDMENIFMLKQKISMLEIGFKTKKKVMVNTLMEMEIFMMVSF